MPPPLLLIVDDDLDVRRTASLLLQDVCEVLEASGGEEALRLLGEKKPKLMLLDVSMPGMSGLDVLRAAKKLRADLTVVMLTSLHDLEIAKEALAAGALMYITKPYDVGYLRREVERLLLLPGASNESEDERPWRISS